MKLGFVGLGVMGFPMAGHLSKSGFDVQVYNRTTSRATQWLQSYQGKVTNRPFDCANEAEIVFVCVGNDDDVRSVVYGEHGVLAGLKSGSILVDHTTTSAELSRELASACRQRQVEFLDAPVSGGQAGAENGQLTIMLGGQQQTYDRVEHVISHYAKFSRLMGETGAGQLTKMVNQICIAGVVQGLAEGLHFARSAGLDGVAVAEVISKGAAGSWQMENRHQTMWDGKYDYGFAVDWMRKDLDIALAEAKRNGSTLPLTALVDQFYAEVQANGGGRWDTSSLLSRLEKTRAK